jgi:membrane protein DedA with SNARE-associated domain
MKPTNQKENYILKKFASLQLIGAATLLAVAGMLIVPPAHWASLTPNITALWIVIVTLAGYFFPSIIAWQRRHHQTLAIFLLNLLLGWTGLGWIGALIWAATAIQPQKENHA